MSEEGEASRPSPTASFKKRTTPLPILQLCELVSPQNDTRKPFSPNPYPRYRRNPHAADNRSRPRASVRFGFFADDCFKKLELAAIWMRRSSEDKPHRQWTQLCEPVAQCSARRLFPITKHRDRKENQDNRRQQFTRAHECRRQVFQEQVHPHADRIAQQVDRIACTAEQNHQAS